MPSRGTMRRPQISGVLVIGGKAAVRQAEAAAEPPETAYKLLDLEAIGSVAAQFCPAVRSERGERARDAFLLAPNTAYATRTEVVGQSAGLALVLESIRATYEIKLTRDVIATGSVGLGSGEQVRTVGTLAAKLDAMIAEARKHAGTLVLIPPADETDGDAVAAQLAEARREGIRVERVATVTDALDLVFGNEAFERKQAALVASRAALAELRFDRRNVDKMTVACGQVLDEVDHLTVQTPLVRQATAEVQHLMRWACRLARQDGKATMRWRGQDRTPEEVEAALNELDDRRGAAAAIPELRAMELNLEAASVMYGSASRFLDFSHGVDRADTAYALDGLVDGLHSERRFILGTRGQLLWRLALRRLGTGDSNEACRTMDRASSDIEAAYGLALANSIDEKNDRARVRVYRANACAARMAISGADAERSCFEEVQADLDVVLGWAAGTGSSEEPKQDPGWGLRVMMLLALQDPPAAATAIERWESVRDRSYEGTRLERYLFERSKGPMPCDLPLLASLLELALATDRLDVFDRLLPYVGRLAPDKLDLQKLAWLWPTARYCFDNERSGELPDALASLFEQLRGKNTHSEAAERVLQVSGEFARSEDRARRLLRTLGKDGDEAALTELLLWLGEPRPRTEDW